jgi:hypothetical protein
MTQSGTPDASRAVIPAWVVIQRSEFLKRLSAASSSSTEQLQRVAP